MRMIAPIAKFDLAFSLFCLQHRFSEPVAKISRIISRTGDGYLYLLIGGLAYWADEVYGRIFLLTGLSAFLLELPLYWLLKNAFQRRRPHEFSSSVKAFITPSDRFSLPSGHTTAGFLMAGLIAHFYPQFTEIAFFWASCIGAARILLGVHFFTDVLVGSLLGTGCMQLILLLSEWTA